ncbi:MAG TPA: hypothetical protein DCZ74_01130 [Treponema sp.]|jgi:hypothetical protein|nr:hypothetical protein [Treponema sp.]
MEELLNLLRDGHSRSLEMLAAELNTDTEDILRRIEFLERAGMIRRVINIKNSCSSCSPKKCASCPGCASHLKESGNSSACASCMPKGGFKNMGEMWEVVAD